MSPAEKPRPRRLDGLPAARLADIRQQLDPLRMLICEPDIAAMARLRYAVAELNVELLECVDGARALYDAGRQHPDALLLAADVPVVRAVDVVRAIRAGGGDLLVAIGHASGQDRLVAEAVSAGADRVLGQPYAPEEIRDLCLTLRGRVELDNPVLRAGALAVYPLAYEIRVDGRRIPMPVRELEVLIYLIRHQDRIVSVAELHDALWAQEGLGPRSNNAVAATVLRLRAKLSDSRRPDVIRTVRRRGYRFYPPEPAADLAPPATVANST